MRHSFRVNFVKGSASKSFIAYTDTEDDKEVLVVGLRTLSRHRRGSQPDAPSEAE